MNPNHRLLFAPLSLLFDLLVSYVSSNASPRLLKKPVLPLNAHGVRTIPRSRRYRVPVASQLSQHSLQKVRRTARTGY